MKLGRFTNLLLLVLDWGILLAAQGYANKYVSSYTTGLFGFIIVVTAYTVYFFSRHAQEELVTLKYWKGKMLLIGCIGFSIQFFTMIGLTFGNAQTGAFLLKTELILVNIVSIIVYKQRFALKDWLVTLVAFVGALFVVNVDFKAMTFTVGDLGYVGGACMMTWNTFNIQGLIKQEKHPVPRNAIAYWNAFITLILFFACVIVFGKGAEFTGVFARPDVVTALTIFGVTQGFCMFMYYKTLDDFPAWIVKATLLLCPIVTLICTIFMYRTIPSAKALFGGVLVLGACLALLLSEGKKQRAEAA